MTFCWLFAVLDQTYFNQYLRPFRAFSFFSSKIITLVAGLGRKHGVHINLNLHRAPGYCVNPPKEPLELWKEAGWGWVLWNLRGSFGLLDSGRADVTYEDFHGHKLDREMLRLLREY